MAKRVMLEGRWLGVGGEWGEGSQPWVEEGLLFPGLHWHPLLGTGDRVSSSGAASQHWCGRGDDRAGTGLIGDDSRREGVQGLWGLGTMGLPPTLVLGAELALPSWPIPVRPSTRAPGPASSLRGPCTAFLSAEFPQEQSQWGPG